MRALKSRGRFDCFDVHNAMCSLTRLQHRSSEQDVELGISHLKRFNIHLHKIVGLTYMICINRMSHYWTAYRRVWQQRKWTTSIATMLNKLANTSKKA